MKKGLPSPLLCILCIVLFIPSIVFAQTRDISGTVKTSTGAPLPGATIQQRNTRNFVIAGDNGEFTIVVTGSNVVLDITAVNYAPAEVTVGTGNNFDIALQDIEASAMDEVIVVAYGTTTRRSNTGAVSAINADAIKDVPTPSFEQALTGRLPGVQVTTTSGQAGSASSIRIRGIGSMNASNEPLYVIDGVPVVSGSVGQMGGQLYTSNNVMNTLNPNDIESISVLKDAAASSLYGSRAANGVVVITTKRGKMGKPQLNFRSSIGFTPTWATENYKPASPQDQMNYFYRIFHDYRTTAGQTDEQANLYALNRLKSRFGIHGYDFSTAGTGLYENVNIVGKTDGVENRDGKYFDWEDALFRTGIYQTNDLSVSGGNSQTRYYSSLSYTKDKGRAYTNEFDRIGGRLNLTQKIAKWLEFGSNINVSFNDKSGYNDTRNTGTNYLYQSSNLLFPLYWPTDYKTGLPYTLRYNSLGYNPLYYDKQWENWSKTLRLSAIESLTFNLLPSLTAKTVFSYDNAEVKDHLYYSPLHYHTTYGATAKGTVFEYSTNIKKILSSNTLNYRKQFGAHGVDILGGFEAEKNQTDYAYASGSNLPSSSLHTVATAGIKDASAYYWGYNMMSYLSRAEYNFDQRYFLSASFRRDGSSRFGPSTKWGNFWSISGAWNAKSESFLKDVEDLDMLKFRASYGVNGTTPSENYGWMSLASFGYNYNNDAGGIITQVGDELLAWEENLTTNIGVDFAALKNRLYGTIEYFNRNSNNLLQDVPISTVTGFGSTLKNIGRMNNRGLEISLGGDIIKTTVFRWSANANTSLIKSKVVELYGGNDIIWSDPTGGDARVQFIYREGQPVYSFYVQEWGGVDPTNGKPIWYTNDETNGDFLHNGRGASNSLSKAKQILSGSPLPKAFGGFNTDVEYKGINLGFNFIYKIGGLLFDAGSRDVAEDGYYWERTRSYYGYQDAWTPDNPNALFPKISGNDPEDGISRTSRHLHNATFLRLKNINLGYTFPAAILNKVRISGARVFFNGTNLVTLSKFKWADPEVNNYGSRGWETPFGKTYTFGIEVNF